jgi:hypothetical protein
VALLSQLVNTLRSEVLGAGQTALPKGGVCGKLLIVRDGRCTVTSAAPVTLTAGACVCVCVCVCVRRSGSERARLASMVPRNAPRSPYFRSLRSPEG